VRAESVTVQAVILTDPVAAAYIAALLGLLIGASIAPWVAAALGG
jgi:hypothetical protein